MTAINRSVLSIASVPAVVNAENATRVPVQIASRFAQLLRASVRTCGINEPLDVGHGLDERSPEGVRELPRLLQRAEPFSALLGYLAQVERSGGGRGVFHPRLNNVTDAIQKGQVLLRDDPALGLVTPLDVRRCHAPTLLHV